MTTPALYISLNQIRSDEFDGVKDLNFDGAWLVPLNSPSITSTQWQSLNKKRTVIEQGALDSNWLFNPNWPPPSPCIDVETLQYGKNPNYTDVYYESGPTYPTLLPSEIALAYSILKRPIISHYRSYNLSILKKVLLMPESYGGCFEFTCDISIVRKQQIHHWIDAVINLGKVPFLLIPPKTNSHNYAHDVVECLEYIEARTNNFSKTRVVLGVYVREKTGVNFLGNSNTVESALSAVKARF